MSKAEQILKRQQAQERREKKEKPVAEGYWGRCQVHGCPLQASIQSNRKTCSFHFGLVGECASAMTESIKDNQQLLVKLSVISSWHPFDWGRKSASLRGWETLPMGEKEPPPMYINRFRQWVTDRINETADNYLMGR